MDCAYKNNHSKSAQTTYNDTVQTFVAESTKVNLLGSLVCDTGCSIQTETADFKIMDSGLYRFAFDITATATGAGLLTVHIYNGETALPCGIVRTTVAASDEVTLHVETMLRLPTCAMIKPMINVHIGGVGGTVNHICATAVRLA